MKRFLNIVKLVTRESGGSSYGIDGFIKHHLNDTKSFCYRVSTKIV